MAATWQLCAGALTGAALPGFELAGAERLTVFSDYRLPQLFQLHGMMVISETLRSSIAAGDEIPQGSPQEVGRPSPNNSAHRTSSRHLSI